MESAHAKSVAQRQEIRQALFQSAAIKTDTARKQVLVESLHLPVEPPPASLPDNLGATLNARA